MYTSMTVEILNGAAAADIPDRWKADGAMFSPKPITITTILPQLSRIGTAPAAISMTTPIMEGSLPGSTVVTPRRMVKHSIGIGMFCEKPL